MLTTNPRIFRQELKGHILRQFFRPQTISRIIETDSDSRNVEAFIVWCFICSLSYNIRFYLNCNYNLHKSLCVHLLLCHHTRYKAFAEDLKSNKTGLKRERAPGEKRNNMPDVN